MTPSPLVLLGAGSAVMVAVMAGLWCVQRRSGDAGIVDVAWAGGIGALAVAWAVLLDGDPIRRILVGVLAGGWSLRLAVHLYRDRIAPPGEDGRYARLREDWGDRFQSTLLLFYLAQGLLAALLTVPHFLAAAHARPAGLPEVLALLLWAVAVGGESLADRQLARFRADPANRGRTCRRGLWRVSRHPNYFFEWLHWWAWVPLAFGHAWWPVALAAPALMLWLVLRVTGIPPTESRALETRGEDYRRYQRTTSAFFPWFPQSDPGPAGKAVPDGGVA